VIKEKQAEVGNNSLESKTAEQKAAIEQRRKDNALLNTYSNEKEIDLARDRNLQQVEARISSIQLLQQSAQESLDNFRKEASTIKAGKQIPASLQADITAAENKIAKLKQDLDAANAKAASVRASFEADKARYRELTGDSKK
jgi:chromosome segregation ATPase